MRNMIACIVLFSIIWIQIPDNHAKAVNFGGSDVQNKVNQNYMEQTTVLNGTFNDKLNNASGNSSEHVLPTGPILRQSIDAILPAIIHRHKQHGCVDECTSLKDIDNSYLSKMCLECELEEMTKEVYITETSDLNGKLEKRHRYTLENILPVFFITSMIIIILGACCYCAQAEKKRFPAKRYEGIHYQPTSTSFSNENLQLVNDNRPNTISDYPICTVNLELKDIKCDPAPSYAPYPNVSAYGSQTHQEQPDSIPDAVLQKAHYQTTINYSPNENQSSANIDVPITSTVSGPVYNGGYGWAIAPSSTCRGTANNL